MRARSILFVCKANRCRSPSAEAVLRAMLGERAPGLGVEIDSAGTHEFRDIPAAHVDAVHAARRRGYEIARGTSRRIRPADFERFDMILAMDKQNVAALQRIAPTQFKHKIELLLEYSERYYGMEVCDPIGGDAAQYDLALDMIEDGCRGLAQYLVRAA